MCVHVWWACAIVCVCVFACVKCFLNNVWNSTIKLCHYSDLFFLAEYFSQCDMHTSSSVTLPLVTRTYLSIIQTHIHIRHSETAKTHNYSYLQTQPYQLVKTFDVESAQKTNRRQKTGSNRIKINFKILQNNIATHFLVPLSAWVAS